MTFVSLNAGVEVIKRHVETLTLDPGVYRMLGDAGEVLYVGKAKHLKKRVHSYTQPDRLPLRLKRMVSLTRSMLFIVTQSEAEALLLEAQLIKKLQPRFNVLLKDDKMFPFIMVQQDHPAPRLEKYRGALQEGPDFFGPFASTRAVNHTIETLNKLFQLRTCKDHVFKNRTRPCLEYHIKRCSAPCVGYIAEADYKEGLSRVKDFLKGKTSKVQDFFESRMMEASADQRYEEAALYRDKLRDLNAVVLQAGSTIPKLPAVDVVAMAQSEGQTCVEVFFYRNGTSYGNASYFLKNTENTSQADAMHVFLLQFYDARRKPPPLVLVSVVPAEIELLEEGLTLLKGSNVDIRCPQRGDLKDVLADAVLNAQKSLARKLHEGLSDKKHLEQVQALFNIPTPIRRIEIYDNSHLFGTSPYASMVVAGPEGLNKKAYRHFKLKSAAGLLGDDYGMMREVFLRRFERLDPDTTPDLILIDGGKGQLGVVQQVASEKGVSIPLVAISKGRDRNAGREWFHPEGVEPFQLPPDDPVLHYLQRLRDEAHRFAIGSHKAARVKKMTTSALDDIPGLGPKRKKALLLYFGSVDRISKSGIKELEKVDGIHHSIAEVIYRYFNGTS